MFLKTKRSINMYFYHFGEMKKFLIAIVALVFFINSFAMILSLKISSINVLGISQIDITVLGNHGFGSRGNSVGESLIYFGQGMPMMGLVLICSYFFVNKLFISDSKKGRLSFWLSTGTSRLSIYIVRYLVLQTFILLFFIPCFIFNIIISTKAVDHFNMKYVIYSGLEFILTSLILNTVLIFGAIVSLDNSTVFTIILIVLLVWVVGVGSIDLIHRQHVGGDESNINKNGIDPLSKALDKISPFAIMPPYFINTGIKDLNYNNVLIVDGKNNYLATATLINTIEKAKFVYAYLIAGPVLFVTSVLGSVIVWYRRNFDRF